MKAWTDNTIMPWGKHKGAKLKELPASYLLWLFEQTWIKDWPQLYAYLKANEKLLMEEREESGSQQDWDDEEGFKSIDDYHRFRGF